MRVFFHLVPKVLVIEEWPFYPTSAAMSQ